MGINRVVNRSVGDLASEFPPEFASEAKNLAIDFDGVLHDDYLGYHDGTCYGPLIEGSYEALQFLSKYFKIIIFTAKAKPSRPLVNGKSGETLVWEWIREKNLDPFVSEVTAEKPRALAYIDDKAVRFESWQDVCQNKIFDGLKGTPIFDTDTRGN